jgi:hypothetical protein
MNDEQNANPEAATDPQGRLDALVSCPRSYIEDLLMYADTAATILKDNGWPGKAQALEQRYMKVAEAIGFDGN